MTRQNIARDASVCVLLLGTLGPNGCGDSLQTLNKLAASGSIHTNAPVVAHVQIEIAAPPTRVWSILIDANAWPTWASQIDSISSPGPLAKGKRFVWSTGGSTIHSQVQLFESEQRLSWTGTAFTAKAIHVWQLSPGHDGETVVTVDESMDGPLMSTLYPSAKLTEADKNWLLALKAAAEKK